jgi:hypothetical protein
MARHLSTYVGLAHRGEQTLADSLRQVASGHPEDPDTVGVCTALARLHDENVRALEGVARRYGEEDVEEPERLHAEALPKTREGGVGLLRDLQDLHMMCALLQSTWTILDQAARGERDKELHALVQDCTKQVERTTTWLTTHLKAASPQILLVGP